MAIPAAAVYGAGIAIQTVGAFGAKNKAKRAARRQKVLAGIQAQQVRASGQGAAFEEQRQAELVHSRALALAAASGGSASDVSATKILSGIEAEGRYRAEVRLHESEGEARMIEATGSARASSLNDQASAYGIGGVANLLTGIGSMYARYGDGGPDKASVSGSGVDTGGSSYLDSYGGPPE